MSDYDFESCGETWYKCPYDRKIVIKEEMMAHLDVCREIYYKTMAAEGRPIDEIICNNWIHFVPKFEEKLHNLLCKETPKDDSDDQQDVMDGVTKQDADSSSGVSGETSSNNLHDSWEEENWEPEDASNDAGK